ncbi:hypothetical protein H112_03893 [Trichophyton rubrum D6]|uniref:Protein kinase subdomain-containing protein n=3 Tax=Trichophyton rubrum TaxID=5551 RepID=A0A178F046_TRIRU|nr:uncharacterized protein TERG_05223 [Trichophyton rubrum CBS 118892]EZF23447.1 hypothetical protein H100_03901 [Trichophyton rubrum MR850]EZF42605.1 hypothetical protein H102_03888 [Trichophyton rubrum CBS 100081]EZF53221.1 hypothetical protein H103_03902 [Trichophyton rubrum CBS 288.86]EZF63704.1 hypothetical protein H104_03887 [Trichophyton rubrum CBS 289.86]EZF85169.1 hypothetical protein H110_03894 [Trichophyton rubrum MR1448]EZF95815.1 hypothetical protein H113_03924 [Trichophyton rubr
MATCLPLLTTSKVPSAGTLDDSHAYCPPSKRLKLDHDNDGAVGKAALAKFTINPCGTSLSDRPHSLYPIALILRSRIPLSWLDTCLSPPRRIRPGSLFTANIPALEQSLSGENASTVLAAAISDTVERHYGEVPKELYVVERVKRCVYAICPLRGEVQEADLAVASKSSGVQDEFGPVQSPSDPFTDSLEFATIPNIDLFQEIPAQAVSFAFGDSPHENPVSSQVDRTGTSPNAALQSPAVATEVSPKEGDNIELGISLPAEYFADSQILPQTNTINNAEDMLSTLKMQYLEALYISKTSVAYFAKGPLTRARAAFQNSDDASSMRPMVLYHYYRSCIIPMKKMDAKYRDSLPRIVADITQSQSDVDEIAPARKRKSKKKTIGKDGLYAGEEEFISKWWKSVYETNSSVEKPAMETQRKRLIEDIRMRETQLQILLILEIMLLEGSVGSQAELDDKNTEKPKKSIKKTHDMATALELLLDRLCIWHTVSSHGLAIDVPVDSTKAATGPGKANHDKLRDFCTEVIIPFYSARLPEKCQVINRKLGGPAISSPARPNRSNQKRSTNPLSKSAKGQPSKRTLQRVGTDEKIPVRAKVPSLARNNTAPATAEVKRESNDQLSFSTSIGGRGGIQKSKRVNNREVDLEAVAKQHESKLKRMNLLVDQKRELDAAINALRKPNRELAVRDFVESAEKRSASSAASHPRKQKNPTRNPFAQGVQVMATPKGPRNKDCGFADLPSLPKAWKQSRPTVMASPIPDPDAQVVPSPSTRPSNTNMLPKSRPILNFSRTEALVHETPSKPSSNGLKRSATSNPVESGIEAELSPILARKSKPCSYESSSINLSLDTSAHSTTAEVGETPPRLKQMMFVSESTVPRRVDFMQPSTPAKGSVQHKIPVTTPLRQRAGDDANRTINETPEKSIYERLGWNNDDDDDDELAFF